MKTLFNSLVVTALIAVGSAFAGTPSVDLALSRSLNVDNLRDANLTIAGEVPSIRVSMGDFRIGLNGMSPHMASLTLGTKLDLVGFDHVNVTLDRNTVEMGLSRDAVIAGALSLTAGVGFVGSDLHNLPIMTSSVSLAYSVW